MIAKANVSPVQAQLGGWWTLKISKNVRMASQSKQVFRQIARIQPEFGPHEGDTYQFLKIGRLNASGQEIGEFGDIPVTDFNHTYGSCTVKEYSNSIALSHWADLYSEISLVDASLITLTNEANELLDNVAAGPFKTADVIYTPTGTVASKSYALSTNGTPGATATRNMSLWDLRNINDLMRATFRVPPWEGSNYLCVSSPFGLRGIREDTEFIEIMKYAQPKVLLNSEVGMVENFRFVEETNALDNSLAGGLLGEMIFIGYDPVVGIETYPFELQAAVADPYGRFRNIRYVWQGGYARVWTYATDGETRIIRVGSL